MKYEKVYQQPEIDKLKAENRKLLDDCALYRERLLEIQDALLLLEHFRDGTIDDCLYRLDMFMDDKEE